MSLSRFKGALVGAVIGDCIGAHFEGQATVKMSEILEYCGKLKMAHQQGKKGFLRFTDDTAMTRSVMGSLKQHNEFNAKDMAGRFAEEFFRDKHRGYGGNVITVFSALTEPDLKDVYQPAREQFDGTGSYGNGGAMRIAPAPLFAFYKNDTSVLENLVSGITRLTHTHHLAIKGAILQAFAVDTSLRLSDESSLDCDKFCDDLISVMRPIETCEMDDTPSPSKRKPAKRELEAGPTPYCAKLEKIKEFLKEKNLQANTVEKVLGNDISALGSVPTAVLAFLRGSTSKTEDLEEENPFKRVILYAISLGGDTDTIATMAGAMAGAYFGLEAIPEEWYFVCEGVEDAKQAAEYFHTLYVHKNSQSSDSPSLDTNESHFM